MRQQVTSLNDVTNARLPRAASPLLRGSLIAASVVAALVAAAVMGICATSWNGTSFPGFFALPNRVVASIGLVGWSSSREGTIYQRTLVAVDGQPVATADDVYRRVAEQPVDQSIVYTIRHGGSTDTVTLRSQAFTATDYWAIFGAYLLNGTAYLLLGLLGAWMLADAPLGRALLVLGGVAGIYALSAVGLYGPGGGMRIHALAEAFFPAALVHLGLVFPRDRGAITKPLAAVAWWLSLALAIPYQLLLEQPGAYSILHGACEFYMGIAGLGLVVSLIIERGRAADTASPLLRAALAGALLGLGVPGILMMLSGLTGGGLPVNISAATAFLFPVCFGYGLVREHVATRRALPVATAGSTA